MIATQPLLATAVFGGAEGYFALVIIASGAFEFIVPKCFYRLRNMDKIGIIEKGRTASLRSRTCVKRNAVFGARFKGLSLYFYIKRESATCQNGLDTYLIRIQTRTAVSRYHPCDYSKQEESRLLNLTG